VIARFADTSFFLALLIPEDEFHPAAVVLAINWRGLLVTTDFVMVEVANRLSPGHSRGVYSKFFRAISTDARMNILPASRALIDEGTELYNARADKDWSLDRLHLIFSDTATGPHGCFDS
jgi:predicted nucleic acid-binding protein